MAKTILAIDDDSDFLVTLKDILEDEGFRVVTLSDPFKTEEFIAKYKPELLLIDILMPGRSGFNILEDFKEKGVHNNIPKMFLTCLDDDVEKMTASAWGVIEYIVKPLNVEAFILRVKDVLG
ncbi:MAG: response regulator [Candidatus Omnitrophica bacterium]|nr:response regulator [Candidatus Omnitrophota bacterium]